MATNTTPTWTDAGALVAATTVAITAYNRITLDLRTRIGARLFVFLGRAGTTAWGANPVELNVRAMYANAADRQPFNNRGRVGNVNTAVAPTFSGNQVAGDQSFTVSSGSGLNADDLVCLGYNTATVEFGKISRVSSNTVYLDAPLLRGHTSGDVITNCADCWEIPLPGGALYEVIVDNNKSATGANLQYLAWYQRYDSDTNT